MSCAVKVLRRENAVAAWPDIKDLLKRVVEVYGQEDELDVLARILLGEYQVFLAVEEKPVAIAITQIQTTRYHKKGIIVYCAGEGLTEWVKFVDIIADWCKAQGCDFVEGTGRKGWERVLAQKGFRLVATTLRKQL